jgi:Holliday junction resolvase
MSKRKGSNAERDLLKAFWERGWAAMRAAGSGSTTFPCPDIIVGRNGRRLVIECKITKDQRKYFTEQEIRELRYFASMFGAESWVAVKFSGHAWHFFTLDDLIATKTQFVITSKDIETKGFSIEEVIV